VALATAKVMTSCESGLQGPSSSPELEQPSHDIARPSVKPQGASVPYRFRPLIRKLVVDPRGRLMVGRGEQPVSDRNRLFECIGLSVDTRVKRKHKY